MGDEYLQELCEKMVSKNPENYNYICSHTSPDRHSSISDLEFLDATTLYSQEVFINFHESFYIKEIDRQKSEEYQECLIYFLQAYDRIDPLGLSVRKKTDFFWNLTSFFEVYFDTRKDIDSVIFCNVPHMPWDILLFFVAKKIGLKTVFMRKTGLGGYIFLDEDFRPGKTNFSFFHSSKKSIKDSEYLASLNMSQLRELNFTKNQIGGAWKRESVSLKEKIKNLIKKIFPGDFLTTLRILKDGLPIMKDNSIKSSKQNSIIAGSNNINFRKYFKLHLTFTKNLKELRNFYQKISISKIPKRKFIYVSLHLQPERSTLPEGGHYNNQSLMIAALSKAIPKDWLIIVKEHPKQFLYDLRNFNARDKSFYKLINDLENVKFIKEDFSQSILIKESSIVATVSGSAAWEALLDLKPSLLFSEAWHSYCDSSPFIKTNKNLAEIIIELSKKTKQEVEKDVLKFIRNYSSFILKGALNLNHLKMFFKEEEKDEVLNNLSSAFLEKLKK